MDWIELYNLATDRERIRHMQEASLSPRQDAGLSTEPFLIGSEEWLKAIEQGSLPIHWVEGVIESPIWASMGDYPEVAIRHSSGEISNWTREGDVTQCSKGRPIKLCYVFHDWKPSLREVMGGPSKIVLRIWVGSGAWRPTSSVGPGPGGRLDEGWEGGLA